MSKPITLLPSSDTDTQTTTPRSAVYQVEKASDVDSDIDGPTPDHWIPRHKSLIRHTGTFPLNAEPPLKQLMSHGLLTPNSLFFVRSHGAAPFLEWNSHKVTIDGFVDEPCDFTMEQLTSLPSIRLPVTFACNGNRRKELNMIKRSKGFNWGPAAIGTAYWRGVLLSDLLRSCKVDTQKGKFVCFESCDSLAKGCYGTSMALGYVMNPYNDVILAYEMNDEPLPPDHGFPVRIIAPGLIGARNVKWLRRITVTDHESTNYYHIYDNKVFPSHLNETDVTGRDLWRDPTYSIYEMNINSVITTPAHYDIIPIDSVDATHTCEVSGYAHSGGGRPVTRVCVSVDNGATWMDCALTGVADDQELRYGYKSYTWVHWKVRILSWSLLRAEELVVRAVDSSFNTQPREPTWNLTGEMNNAYYKIKVEVVQNHSKGPSVVFHHPVEAGAKFGGWMVANENNTLKLIPSVTTTALREITPQELEQHNSEEDCWVSIEGGVFDLTTYLKEHPGGSIPILLHAGKDATTEFREIHSTAAYICRQMYRIGTLVQRSVAPLSAETGVESALTPRRWLEVELISKKEVSPDTRKLKFQLVDNVENKKIGLPVGQHILLGVDIKEYFVVRPYTPISPIGLEEDDGTFELVVKVYFAGTSTVFPQGGTMSQYLDKLEIGDRVKVKGPAGPVFYHGHGNFTVRSESFRARRVNLVGGGSGITPLYQLARAIMQDPSDKTRVALVFANRAFEDILLKKELDKMAKEHPNQFSLWYTVNEMPREEGQEWKYSVGIVDRNMFKSHLFPPTSETVTFLCGPPGMLEHACFPFLEEMGFTEKNLFEF